MGAAKNPPHEPARSQRLGKALKRQPHCSETCNSCADMQGMIGDRDEQIRQLHARACAGDRAVEQLAEVVYVLDQAEVPKDRGRPHERLTVAGRVHWLVWQRALLRQTLGIQEIVGAQDE